MSERTNYQGEDPGAVPGASTGTTTGKDEGKGNTTELSSVEIAKALPGMGIGGLFGALLALAAIGGMEEPRRVGGFGKKCARKGCGRSAMSGYIWCPAHAACDASVSCDEVPAVPSNPLPRDGEYIEADGHTWKVGTVQRPAQSFWAYYDEGARPVTHVFHIWDEGRVWQRCVCPHPIDKPAYVHDVACPVDHKLAKLGREAQLGTVPDWPCMSGTSLGQPIPEEEEQPNDGAPSSPPVLRLCKGIPTQQGPADACDCVLGAEVTGDRCAICQGWMDLHSHCDVCMRGVKGFAASGQLCIEHRREGEKLLSHAGGENKIPGHPEIAAALQWLCDAKRTRDVAMRRAEEAWERLADRSDLDPVTVALCKQLRDAEVYQ
jgi:hypothetical protein